MNTRSLDPFYLIVDSADWVARLVPIGVKLVQLRIKDRPLSEITKHIRDAKHICARHDCQLIVNDYWSVALDEGCDFVHLGQEDLRDADLGALRRAGVRTGISTHTAAELEKALTLAPDYVALGPIFETRLKKMKWGPQGLDRVGEWKRRIGGRPLVAIGGLTPERAQHALQAGADSTAVVTDILLHPDPEARTRAWLRATRGDML